MTKATICALAWERHVGLEQNSSEAKARAVLNNLGFGRIAKDPTPLLGCSSNANNTTIGTKYCSEKLYDFESRWVKMSGGGNNETFWLFKSVRSNVTS